MTSFGGVCTIIAFPIYQVTCNNCWKTFPSMELREKWFNRGGGYHFFRMSSWTLLTKGACINRCNHSKLQGLIRMKNVQKILKRFPLMSFDHECHTTNDIHTPATKATQISMVRVWSLAAPQPHAGVYGSLLKALKRWSDFLDSYDAVWYLAAVNRPTVILTWCFYYTVHLATHSNRPL